ncbi:L-idonate 5-dehydrogenase [Kribbella sp.]|uniref:L-idonate 5-dehydrogenase n=1 Tax=Kribbella sp. TaxID=1871183 RepID=UPI002D49679D|nr:L-idonate 5-dehydrogenase [Kribbella sp.]HZX04869.1 L-idonate 5-dehydrogenase [Kribbella sp.]
MDACVVHGAGDLRVEEQAAVEPGAGQVAVRIAYGGICGTDLHYYRDGGVGNFRVQEPLVLGHEVAGWVSAGELPAGTPVGIHPATPCGECPECLQDRRNICAFSNYLGSAARVPHIQGGFVRELILPADQVRVLPAGLELRRAVLAEPLSVAIHAVRRAGDGAVAGKRVLVTGAGPIGLLVVAALRRAGAREVIATDLHETPLALAKQVGATATIDARATDWPDEIDIAIEASGTAGGLRTSVERVRRGGTVVQVGSLPPGDTGFPGALLMTRELTLTGAFRFDHEFDTAIEWLAGGLYVDPIVTHTFPLAEAVAAFELASDRTVASKVLLEVNAEPPP